jgi:phospholipase C
MQSNSPARVLTAALTIAVAGAALLVAGGWSAPQSALGARQSTTASSPIKHIIVILRENHSFDNLFGRFPGVDGTTTARESSKLVKLGTTPDRLTMDMGTTAVVLYRRSMTARWISSTRYIAPSSAWQRPASRVLPASSARDIRTFPSRRTAKPRYRTTGHMRPTSE